MRLLFLKIFFIFFSNRNQIEFAALTDICCPVIDFANVKKAFFFECNFSDLYLLIISFKILSFFLRLFIANNQFLFVNVII